MLIQLTQMEAKDTNAGRQTIAHRKSIVEKGGDSNSKCQLASHPPLLTPCFTTVDSEQDFRRDCHSPHPQTFAILYIHPSPSFYVTLRNFCKLLQQIMTLMTTKQTQNHRDMETISKSPPPVSRFETQSNKKTRKETATINVSIGKKESLLLFVRLFLESQGHRIDAVPESCFVRRPVVENMT